MNEYPEIDGDVVAAARALLTAAMENRARTEQTIAETESALQGCHARRAAAIDAMARGETPNQTAQKASEIAVLRLETDLTRLRAVAARQAELVTAAEQSMREANGKAHHPKVIHAIREQAAARAEMLAARQALASAEARDREAHNVLTAAFGAGYPLPVALRPSPGGGYWAGMGKPVGGDETALRAMWGREIGDEAFGQTPASLGAAE